MKNIIFISVLLCVVLFLGACAQGTGGDTVNTNIQNNTTGSNSNAVQTVNIPASQMGWTTAVPSEYNEPFDHPGTVVPFDYESKDYAGNGGTVSKTAYVYLPYGYDENDTDIKYDIIYLMHGWGGYAGQYLQGEGAVIKNTLDHMIESGEVKPVIAVSPSFYHEGSGTDFSSSVAAFRAFYQEFENDLMPAVEGEFHTYTAGTSKEELAASRDHRAFGGFSLGSVTTWLQLCENSEYIRYFLPMSGSCWYYGGYGDFRIEQNADHLEEVIRDNDLEEKGTLSILRSEPTME